MRATILLVFIVGLLFAVGSLISRQHEALRGLQAVRLPLDVAVHRIATYAENNLPACFLALDGEAAALTRALVAVEYVSVSRIEHAVEFVLAQVAQLTGAPLPDLSYGAAQVRPSTLAKLRPKAPPQARDFVNDCASIEIGRTVVSSLLEKHHYVTPPEARLLRVIRDYTGQAQYRREHIVHNAIVAQLYAGYKK